MLNVSVFADATTNISTTDQFSLCEPYVGGTEVKVCEQFLQLVWEHIGPGTGQFTC